MNAIILVVDRLHAGYVGAYGNSWIETPALDRLAVRSAVFDHCLVESPHLDALCGGWWQGRHPLAGPVGPTERPTLPSLLGASGVATTLVTDEPTVASHPLASTFDALVPLGSPGVCDPRESARVAGEIHETYLARCFAQIIDWLDSAREPFFLWCHLAGLGSVWDAPLEFRARYVEPGDPDPPDSAEVPCQMLGDDYDPDHLLGISQAYAGQVSLLDVCVGTLLELLETSPAGQGTLLTLISARGFPLGEHRRVGACDGSLYGELVHVPLWLRFPDALGEAVRSQALVSPADLFPTLLQWWGIAAPPSPAAASLLPLVREEVQSLRDRLCLAGDGGERAIRTPAWHLRDAGRAELFAKPDDRWEVNDVADRCPDVVERLRSALLEYERLLRSDGLKGLSPLDEVLMAGLE